MPLVDDADVQIHLPVDTLKIEQIPDDKAEAFEDAERIIRGYLAGVVDSAIMDTWDEPDDTPETIRAIAGRLAAAKIYRLRFGQSSMTDPEYAQQLYNEAMQMLNDIISGAIELPDVDIPGDFDNTWFFPNDTDIPVFTKAARY